MRGGVETAASPQSPGITVTSIIHDVTQFPEDAILYFTDFGPIRYIDDDNTVGFLDWQGVVKAAEEARPKPLRTELRPSALSQLAGSAMEDDPDCDIGIGLKISQINAVSNLVQAMLLR